MYAQPESGSTSAVIRHADSYPTTIVFIEHSKLYHPQSLSPLLLVPEGKSFTVHDGNPRHK